MAKKYKKNCKAITEGMTIEKAKLIMGDYDNPRHRSEIWTLFNKDKEKVYYLSYPATPGASTGTFIYFDPVTQTVTKTVCGE